MTFPTCPELPNCNRGFASMVLSKKREIASKGGKAACAKGRAHAFTADEARADAVASRLPFASHSPDATRASSRS